MDTQEKINQFSSIFSNQNTEFWIGAIGYFTNWMNLYGTYLIISTINFTTILRILFTIISFNGNKKSQLS